MFSIVHHSLHERWMLFFALLFKCRSDASKFSDTTFVFHVVIESATTEFRFQPCVHGTASMRHESLLLLSKAVDPVVLSPVGL